MADSKISALPAATVPLAGTEVLPIVQSSTTKQVSVANLTAGRAISASSVTNAALTSGRVTYAGASGLLTDSANLTFDGTTLKVSATTVMVSGSMPAFSAYASSTTSLTAGAYTKVAYATKSFDTATCYNNTGSTVTLNGISVPAYSFAPNVAGYYQINANQTLNGASTNSVLALYKNGSGWALASGNAAATIPYFQLSNLVYCNGTSDYVGIYLYNDTISLTTGSGGTNYQFSGTLVRAA